MRGRGFRLLLAVLWVAGIVDAETVRGDDASQVAILFNTRSPRSREVAEFYGRSRGVPADQWIGLECSSETTLTRTAYETEIQTPLRRILAERGLAKFDPATPALMTGTKLRYLLLVYGMPYRIQHDSNRVESAAASVPQNLQYNGGSVDGDLMLLPTPPPVLITGPISNPFFASTNAAALRPETGVFLVSRIDGPTPELAMGLVRKALEAERDGLWGRAFLDLRGLKDGPYKLGDDWLASAEAVCRVLGFETEVDRNEATFGPGYPLSDVAIYAGWYDANASGPFALPSVDFRPGAIAYHLHSFSAHDPRSTTANWVGPLVARGATVTLGCVDEPYLQMTPNFGAFLARFATGMNFAEAGAVSQPALSWQTLLIGDPLYRPFSPDLFARSKRIEEQGPAALLPWTYLHRVNFFVQNGGDPGKVITDLESLPLSATNAVLAAKIAHLHAAKTRLKPAITWAQKSLAAGGAAPERGRLMLELAGWQQTMDKMADAAATLRGFANEFPNSPELLSVRRQQLEYARDLDQAAEVEFLKAEVQRLSAAAKPAGP
ncbi:MAG: TIGR03790 family protein [Verrucomicrobiales bacterium]|nr:TIGR03790 family protein [Verrucomicrobiales bacterium]